MNTIELVISGIVTGALVLSYYLGFRKARKDTPFTLACKLNKHLSDQLERARAENARLTTVIVTMKMTAQSQDFTPSVRGMADLLKRHYPMVEPNLPENDHEEVEIASEPFTLDGGLA